MPRRLGRAVLGYAHSGCPLRPVHDGEKPWLHRCGGYKTCPRHRDEHGRSECRDAWGVRFLDMLIQDVRFGQCMMAKNPGFTAVAVITLALGIGMNTAMFSVIDGVLLQPLPYPEPERIVQVAIVSRGQGNWTSFSAKQFDFWNAHSEPFQQLAAMTSVGFNLVGGIRPERVRALRVSTGYFPVLDR